MKTNLFSGLIPTLIWFRIFTLPFSVKIFRPRTVGSTVTKYYTFKQKRRYLAWIVLSSVPSLNLSFPVYWWAVGKLFSSNLLTSAKVTRIWPQYPVIRWLSGICRYNQCVLSMGINCVLIQCTQKIRHSVILSIWVCWVWIWIEYSLFWSI